MGNRLVSLRGDGPWRGRSTRATVDRGDRRQIKIENGYVSGDGHEVRQFPGFKTVVDLTEENNQLGGFTKFAWDFWLPYLKTPIEGYSFQHSGSPVSEILTLEAWCRPVHLHGFEQVRGKLILFGESDERKIPIFEPDNRDQLFVRRVRVHNSPDAWEMELATSTGSPPSALITPPLYTSTNNAGSGMHGLQTSDVVWIEGVTVSDGQDVTQALLDQYINNKFHFVQSTPSTPNRIQLQTDVPGGGALAWANALFGKIYRAKHNHSGSYSPGIPRYYTPDQFSRIDDPDALTCWTVSGALTIQDPLPTAYVSWVANRQRDYGDIQTATPIEGVSTGGNRQGVSRRRQRALEYRLNPEVGGNRLLFAAPGYGCLFQFPLVAPNDGDEWPVIGTDDWEENLGLGIKAPYNDLHDKPRSLGIPKASLVESLVTPFSPLLASNVPRNVSAYYLARGDGFTDADGTLRFAISFQDEYTGEEGLACDPVTITFPGAPGGGSWSLAVNYIHPGYYMPECLALKVNLYIGIGVDGPLGFYKSYPLKNDILYGFAGEPAVPHRSAKYGLATDVVFSPGAAPLYGTIQVLPPVNTSPLEDDIDYTRLAPTVNQMPRGAECIRYIRGVGLSVGHVGTHGAKGELRFTRLSSLYDSEASLPQWLREKEIMDRGATQNAVLLGSPVSRTIGAEDGPFGLGSNYFPPAYQGTSVWSFDLYPAPRNLLAIEKVANFATVRTYEGTASTSDTDLNRTAMHAQRLEMREGVFDKDVVISPSATTPGTVDAPHRESYHVLPRGQLQVSEPGRPDVTASTEIQFIDPNKDDDGVAIGNYGGAAVICSMRETFLLNWHRAPQGQVPQLLSNEFGCIATNSMVEFDSGLAWISERGPVAMMGGSPQFVGQDLEDDFHGADRRYIKDSRGLMRHCWGAHDKSRGIVLWGMISTEATHTVDWEGVSTTFPLGNDSVRSRFPCDEILIWSYRANAFSTWRPPSGLEVLWMRPITDTSGDTRMAFLAADFRIYILDDIWQDTNASVFRSVMPSTQLTPDQTIQSSVSFEIDVLGGNGGTARGLGDNLVRVGMRCLLLNGDTSNDGKDFLKYKNQGIITSATPATLQIALDTAWTWNKGDIVLIGVRQPLTIETTYHGDSLDTTDLEAVQMRHAIVAPDTASPSYAKVSVNRTAKEVLEPREVGYTDDTEYQLLGRPLTTDRVGYRRAFTQGRAVGPEVSVKVEVLGAAQVRVTDILAEMGNVG